MIEYYSF